MREYSAAYRTSRILVQALSVADRSASVLGNIPYLPETWRFLCGPGTGHAEAGLYPDASDRENLGIMTAASTAMITITIISSINERPV